MTHKEIFERLLNGEKLRFTESYEGGFFFLGKEGNICDEDCEEIFSFECESKGIEVYKEPETVNVLGKTYLTSDIKGLKEVSDE